MNYNEFTPKIGEKVKMNVNLPNNYKINKKDIILYAIAIIICIVALTIIVAIIFLGEDVVQKNKVEIATEEEKIELRTNFENMFKNNLTGEIQDIEKNNNDKDYVYTALEATNTSENNYSLNVHIPEINIKNDVITEINTDIAKRYKQEVSNVLNSKGKNTIYSIEYEAHVENNILFLTIRSNLKQSNNAQKLMIYTYNYDLKEQKSHTLDELIQILNYDKTEIQNLINSEIKSQEENANSLKELGYSIYLRDSSSDIYKVENSDYFFIKDGTLYIIYPYGNEAVTSEMDLVII